MLQLKRLSFLIILCLSFSSFAKKKVDDAKNADNIEATMKEIKPEVTPKKPRKILVYSKPSGFKHASIKTCDKMLKVMAEKTKAFTVEFGDISKFTPETLKTYDAVLFNNTTKCEKDFKDPATREALLNYIKNGGGYIGIHSASDAGYPQWPEYTKMVGGTFDGHPWNAGGTWGIRNEDPKNPILKPFDGKNFKIKDELYKYKEYDRSTMRVLLSIDVEVSPKGKKERQDKDHALVWVKNYGKGRIFFSSLGHNHGVFWHKQVVQMWLNGIQFAVGDLECETKSLPQPK